MQSRIFAIFLLVCFQALVSSCSQAAKPAQISECQANRLGPDALDRLANAPTTLDELFELCKPEIERLMNGLLKTPGDDHLKAVFASHAAYSARPYGGSVALTPAQLYRSDKLDCDNYNMLAGHMYRQLGGVAPWRFVGYYGGALGNHSLAILEAEPALILDPTTNIIALGDFNALTGGKPISKLRSLAWRDELKTYHDRIRSALANGKTRPGDLLYWFPGVEAYARNSAASNWKTTPAAEALRQDFAQNQ